MRASARTKTKRAAAAAVIAAVRAEVFRLDPRCVVCQAEPRETDEMHEVVPRSRTRGLPPEQRFNAGTCCRLCRRCHRDVTEHRIEMAVSAPALLPHRTGFVLARPGLPTTCYVVAGVYALVGGTVRRGVWTPEVETGAVIMEAIMESKTKPAAATKAKPVTPERRKPRDGKA